MKLCESRGSCMVIWSFVVVAVIDAAASVVDVIVGIVDGEDVV